TRAGTPLRRGAALARRRAARRRRGAAGPRGRRPRRADLPPVARAPSRLGPPDGGGPLDRRPHRAARAVEEPVRGATSLRACDLRATVLERRARLGDRTRGVGRRGVRPPPADARVALADLVRT